MLEVLFLINHIRPAGAFLKKPDSSGNRRAKKVHDFRGLQSMLRATSKIAAKFIPATTLTWSLSCEIMQARL